MKNIFMNKNIPITNSVIFNNYSIQNIIITPTKIVTHRNSPKISNNLIVKDQVSYSPSTKQSTIKKASNMEEDMEQTNYSKIFNPLTSHKSAIKLKCYKIKNSRLIPASDRESR